MDLFTPRVASQPPAYMIESDSDESEWEEEGGLRAHPTRDGESEGRIGEDVTVEFKGATSGGNVYVGFGYERDVVNERRANLGVVKLGNKEIGTIYKVQDEGDINISFTLTSTSLPYTTQWNLSAKLLSTLLPSSIFIITSHAISGTLSTSNTPSSTTLSQGGRAPLQPPSHITDLPASLLVLAHVQKITVQVICIKGGGRKIPVGVVDYGYADEDEGPQDEVQGWRKVKEEKKRVRGDPTMYI